MPVWSIWELMQLSSALEKIVIFLMLQVLEKAINALFFIS